jgi:SWI2/SNF2 ATPase
LFDRTRLVRQASDAFRTAGMPSMHVPESSYNLRKLVRSGESGVIFTTIHKFADAGNLSDRDKIIVLVDEAHRTQEGSLGEQMRAAVPNAMFFGMTLEGSDRLYFSASRTDPRFSCRQHERARSGHPWIAASVAALPTHGSGFRSGFVRDDRSGLFRRISRPGRQRIARPRRDNRQTISDGWC